MKPPLKKLGDLVGILSGYAFDSQYFNESIGLKLIRIRDIIRGYSNTCYSGQYEEKYIVNKGDMLISMDGEFNITKWEGAPALLNQRVCKIDVTDKQLNKNYLLYFLPQQLKMIENVTPFVTVKHLSVKKINEIEIPLPSLTEQKNIINQLETVDKVLSLRNKTVLKLNELAHSMFEDIFGNPINNDKKWPTLKLGGLVKKIGSGATPRGGSSSYKSKGISLIRSLNVHDGIFKLKKLAFIDEEQALKLSNVKVEKNDILLNITGASVARVCTVPESVLPARVNQHVMIIRPKTNLNPIFLERLFLNSEIKKKLFLIAGSGATREAITKMTMENFEMIVPPIEVQNDFANKFKNLKYLENNTLLHLNKTNNLSLSLKHKLFPLN